MTRSAIIIANFGTSISDAYKNGIKPVFETVSRHYPEYQVVQSYTSRMIINKLKKDRDIHIETPFEAAKRLCGEGMERLIVLTTHIIPGIEYEKVLKDIHKVKEIYPDVVIDATGALLSTEEDLSEICLAFKEEYECLKEEEVLVVMGHGSEHKAHQVYFRFLNALKKHSDSVYFTAVEFADETAQNANFEQTAKILKRQGIKRAVVKPLMITAGDHVLNDMASDDEDSLKSLLEAEGIQSECIVSGLGGHKVVQDMFIRHLEEIL